MRFRPCIDIHNGKVKQIVGGSLRDEGDSASTNFSSEKGAAFYADLYRKDHLTGGHIILLNPATSKYYKKTKEQARRALEMGADYLGSGAWHATSTKPEALPIKEETYLEILNAAPIPNVAIGGLTPENCGRPLELGASGLAVAGGILGADSITEAVRRFRERLRENGNRK